jgi:fatty-acyl-CoA synthase
MRSELEYALNKVECKALILASGFGVCTDYIAILRSLSSDMTHVTTEWRSASVPSLHHVIRLGGERTPGLLTFDDLLRPASAEDLAPGRARRGLQFDDPINIQFTSGTTGAPKGATLTHHNILNNAFFVGEAVNLGARDRVCIPVPLYHCFGMVIGVLGCMTHGAAMVLPGELDALAVLAHGAGRTLHRALWRADDVHRRAGPCRFAEHDL